MKIGWMILGCAILILGFVIAVGGLWGFSYLAKDLGEWAILPAAFSGCISLGVGAMLMFIGIGTICESGQ